MSEIVYVIEHISDFLNIPEKHLDACIEAFRDKMHVVHAWDNYIRALQKTSKITVHATTGFQTIRIEMYNGTGAVVPVVDKKCTQCGKRDCCQAVEQPA